MQLETALFPDPGIENQRHLRLKQISTESALVTLPPTAEGKTC